VLRLTTNKVAQSIHRIVPDHLQNAKGLRSSNAGNCGRDKVRWRIEWMFDTSTPPLKEYTATDTNVFTVSEPGTFANPLTERSCELPGLCRLQRSAGCKWIMNKGLDQMQLPSALWAAHIGRWELIQCKFGGRACCRS
jgi:hypothetical protein